MKTPAECYDASPRPYPPRIEEPQYPAEFEVRRVAKGEIRWRVRRVFVGNGLNGERIGLEQIGDGLWRAWYSFYELGRLDERKGRLLPPPQPAGPARNRPRKATTSTRRSPEAPTGCRRPTAL